MISIVGGKNCWPFNEWKGGVGGGATDCVKAKEGGTVEAGDSVGEAGTNEGGGE